MKYKHLKPIIIILLVLTILVFLRNSFFLFLSGFVRENNAIAITDNNREMIAALLEENVDCYEEIPDIDQAVEIEYLVLMHKEVITVYYADQTNYSFFIRNGYYNPLIQYIKDEGYIVYFKSSEFQEDLIKVCIPLSVSIIFAVILVIGRFKAKKVLK